MGKYKEDRAFTDKAHKLALEKIYELLGWIEKTYNEKLDNEFGIDYIFIDRRTNKILTVQERFRRYQYLCYNDVTIRFKRDFNRNKERLNSEFFKIIADYFVYGILNKEENDFEKIAVINLKEMKKLIKENIVVIEEKSDKNECWIENGALHCPKNFNRDNSSSFIPIDIVKLKKVVNIDKFKRIIVLQKGYLEDSY